MHPIKRTIFGGLLMVCLSQAAAQVGPGPSQVKTLNGTGAGTAYEVGQVSFDAKGDRYEGLEKGKSEGLLMGFENGVEGILGACRFLKENPTVSDDEMMHRFSLSGETVSRVRSMIQS